MISGFFTLLTWAFYITLAIVLWPVFKMFLYLLWVIIKYGFAALQERWMLAKYRFRQGMRDSINEKHSRRHHDKDWYRRPTAQEEPKKIRKRTFTTNNDITDVKVKEKK